MGELVPAVAAAGRFPLAEMLGGKTFGEGTCRETGAGSDGVCVSVCVSMRVHYIARRAGAFRNRRALTYFSLVTDNLPCYKVLIAKK